jgi:hypothetical protein
MGLDMLVKAEAYPEKIDIQYYRKHHDLHGWMTRRYYEKGGTESSFNCIPLELTEEDLDDLEQAINNHELPHTEGFFFGDNPPSEESNKRDLEMISRAREYLSLGYKIIYNSWW